MEVRIKISKKVADRISIEGISSGDRNNVIKNYFLADDKNVTFNKASSEVFIKFEISEKEWLNIKKKLKSLKINIPDYLESKVKHYS